MVRYLGLDVRRASIEACMVDAQGHILHRYTVATTREAIREFSREHLLPTDRLALEATGNSWAIASLLRPVVAEVVISNPLTTKAIAQAQIKTDKVDALTLAQLLRTNYLPRVWQPDETTARRRALTHRRATLVAERTRLKNRIHGILAHELVPLPKEGLFTAAGQRWLARVELPPLEREYVDSDLRLLADCQRELDQMEQRLIAEADAEPQIRLLMTLPGVDYTVALSVLAALGTDLTRFRDGGHAAAYLGLNPSTRQSGKHCYHGPITKHGNARARWLLIQAAQHVGTHPGPLGVFFRKLLKRKNRNIAVVATARKLAVVAWHMLKNNEPYRYAQPEATKTKLQRLRVRASGERRKTGPKKGGPASPNQGTGVRTREVPSLAEVCRQEGLPMPVAPEQLAPGERKMLSELGLLEWLEALHTTRRRVRKTRAQQPEPAVGGPAEGPAQAGAPAAMAST